MIVVEANHKTDLLLGYAGESERTCVEFDLTALAEEYPNGVVTLLVRRPGETAMYPALLIQDGNTYRWYVNVSDTAFDGDGMCQLTYQVGTVICKTHRWPTHILESMTGETVDPPAPWESWVEDVLAAADEVKEAVRTVPEAIDAALREAKESGEFDGVGIASIRMNADYTLTITLTDGSHYDTDPVRGPKGDKGDTGLTPDMSIGNVETLAPGSQATADFRGTPEAPILDLGIPQGQQGRQGDPGRKGDTGVSITGATLNQDYTLTISFSDGTSTTTPPIRGEKGDKGDTGAVPNISIGTVETLPAGSAATASMSGTPENPVLNMGIPQGVPGEVTLAQLMTRAPVILNKADGSIAAFADGADGMPIRSLIAAIDPAQEGSGAAAPDNVRSLIARTGLNLYRRGKNVLQNKAESGSESGITWTVNPDGSVTLSGTATANVNIQINPSATASRQIIGYGPLQLVCSARADYNPSISGLNFQSDVYVDGTFVFTLQYGSPTRLYDAGVLAIRNSRIRINSGTTIPDGTVFYPQIETGSTPTAYEAFSTETDIAVDWQEVAGAIYGGSRNLITGEMLIEWAEVTLPNSFTIRTSGTGTGKYVLFNSGVTMLFDDNVAGVYAEKANGIPRANRGNAWEIYVTNATQLSMFVPADATAESVAAAVGGSKAIVRLAEPLTVQAETLSLLTKYGGNSIFTDVGGVAVEYSADTRLYIDALTKPDTDMVADADIPSGKYFSVNNRLFLSTAAIARGSAVVPYSNCVETSIAEALNNLIS